MIIDENVPESDILIGCLPNRPVHLKGEFHSRFQTDG